jgi:hypothetical protein
VMSEVHGTVFPGDLSRKYLEGGPGTYTTPTPVAWNPTWTKK